MPVEVILPKVDMDMTSARISKWHVKDGDAIRKGDAIFEIETDKAAMEIEAPAEGIVRQISVAEGTTAPVGSAVAFIYAPGEALTTPAPAPAIETKTPQDATPASVPTGPAPSSASLNGEKPRATPLARRLARQKGLSLDTLNGSGPRGRIVAADVNGQQHPAQPSPPVSATPPGMALARSDDDHDRLPLSPMRRTIAARLTQSKQTIPHFYLTTTCTMNHVAALRERLNLQAPRGANGEPAWKISINDFIIKAMALALQKVPRANVTWADDSILQHRTSDIGVAVAVEDGLFTPVVRMVETKGLAQISRDMKDLAARARSRQLMPFEYQGGTTAISNLGMHGIESFTAIINPPHASILAVGAIVERFVPVKGQPVVAEQMTATLSCDHRAIDGALGAELLAAFRSYIEEPALMLA